MNAMTQATELGFAVFTEEAVARMQELYEGHEVKAITVEKNNGICLTGIVIMSKDTTGEISLFPTIYLDELYEEYLDGTDMDEIADRIAECYEENKGQDAAIVNDILHFDAVKDTICYRLINAGMNEAYLMKIPHRLFLDLAIVYCIPVTMEDESRGTIAVTDDYTRMWHVDEKTLYACAKANTERLFPAELKTLDEIICETFHEADMPDVKSGLSILRNSVGGGGAGAVLQEGILRGFADEYGDFYIIPSSICEVLLFPLSHAPEYVTKESISGIVRDVNENQVRPEEVLADHAYLYHADTGTIGILE